MDEKSFDELFEIAKSNGLTDQQSVYDAHKKQMLEFWDELLTEDAEFEIIKPKELPSINSIVKEDKK